MRLPRGFVESKSRALAPAALCALLAIACGPTGGDADSGAPVRRDASGMDASETGPPRPDAAAAPDAEAPDASSHDAGLDADAGPEVDAGPPPIRPLFEEVSIAAGVSGPHELPSTCISGRVACEDDFLSGGAAVGDYDGDGWPDLYVTNLGGRDSLYRNLGARPSDRGRFEDASEAAGLAGYDLHSNGAAFADVDRDGDLDLYVTVVGIPGSESSPNHRYYLFLNDGAGRFTEHAVERGLALADGNRHGGTSVAVGDYDRDGHLDLHVNEWTPRVGTRPHTRLFHNRGAAEPGTFDDVTVSAGVLTFSQPCWDLERDCSSYAFASAFSDIDGDGFVDLAITSDFGTSRLFWNQGDGTFVLGFRTSAIGGDENGMGSTIGDIDGDGDLDWFISSIWDPESRCATEACTWGTSGNRVLRNVGGRVLEDATSELGAREGGWGWGSALFDYDNDGDLDLVEVNGIAFPSVPFEDPYNVERMYFWENDGAGHMTEVGLLVGLTDDGSGKGLVVFDYDRDGHLDVFLVNNGGSPRLYRNLGGEDNPWLRVRTVGVSSNIAGLGARVHVVVGGRTLMREVGSTTHFLGQSESTAHFGLGAGATRADSVTVAWPSGRTSVLTDVDARQEITVVEPG